MHCLQTWAEELWAGLCWAGWVQRDRSHLTYWQPCLWHLFLEWLLKAWAEGLACSLFPFLPWGPACSDEWPVGDTQLPRRSEGGLEVKTRAVRHPAVPQHPASVCVLKNLHPQLLGWRGASRPLLAASLSWSSSRRVARHCHHHIIP